MWTHPTEGFVPFGDNQAAITGVSSRLPNDDNLRKCRFVTLYFAVTSGIVRIRITGNAPAAGTGRPINDGSWTVLTQAEAELLRMILDTATSATWYATYYRT